MASALKRIPWKPAHSPFGSAVIVKRIQKEGTHHTQVPCAGSSGVGPAVLKAMGPGEVAPDLRRGVPGAERDNTQIL